MPEIDLFSPGFSAWGEKPSSLTFPHKTVPQTTNNVLKMIDPSLPGEPLLCLSSNTTSTKIFPGSPGGIEIPSFVSPCAWYLLPSWHLWHSVVTGCLPYCQYVLSGKNPACIYIPHQSLQLAQRKCGRKTGEGRTKVTRSFKYFQVFTVPTVSSFVKQE